VQLEGEPQLTAQLGQTLLRRSVATQAPAGCPLLHARLSRSHGGIVVSVHQGRGESERLVGDLTVAAALIESWVRSDISSPLLLAPELLAAPAAIAPPPPPVAVAVAPRPRFSATVLFEPGVDKDGTAWLGGSLHGCAPVGPLCLGVVLRLAGDLPLALPSGLSDHRVLVDALGSLSWPLRWRRLTLSPGLGIGAGWVHHSIRQSPPTKRDSDDLAPTAVQAVANDGGLRVELGLRLALRLRAGLGLAAGLAFDAALLDSPGAPLGTGESLPMTPWATLRGGLGLCWSSP
jgi:hypothetical protein